MCCNARKFDTHVEKKVDEVVINYLSKGTHLYCHNWQRLIAKVSFLERTLRLMRNGSISTKRDTESVGKLYSHIFHFPSDSETSHIFHAHNKYVKKGIEQANEGSRTVCRLSFPLALSARESAKQPWISSNLRRDTCESRRGFPGQGTGKIRD